MPVEIRELTVKVNINQQQPGNATAAVSPVGTTGNNDEKEDLIKDTIEQVFRILENKKER